MSTEALVKKWPVFEHRPFEEAGFSHLTLPFRATSRGKDDQSYALALSFLISQALDWGDGSYCSRHAYFVFKRDQEWMRPLTKSYDPKVISEATRRWQANFAIGGTLERTERGVAGTLLIYDREGKVILKREYRRARSFFDLLGDMSVDALKELGDRPSPGLVKLLRSPRCKDDQSLIDLGRVAFAPERSQEEFGIYERILARDPEFADVRYWLANQRMWKTGDQSEFDQAKTRCLESYLMPAVLRNLNPGDESSVGAEAWLAKARALLGRTSPTVLEVNYRLRTSDRETLAGRLDHALETAARYPNSFNLLGNIAWFLQNRSWGLADCDLAIAVTLTMIRNRYLPGTYRVFRKFVRRMAVSMMELGDYGSATGVLEGNITAAASDEDAEEVVTSAGELVKAYRKMGHHEKARDLGVQILRTVNANAIEQRLPLVLQTVIAAAQMGDLKTSSEVAARYGRGDRTTTDIARFYREFMEGRSATLAGKIEQIPYRSGVNAAFVVLMAEADLASGTTTQRETLDIMLLASPNDRELWILYDAYERQSPRPEASFFYESLAWLHPEDAWVQRAFEDYRRRKGAVAHVDVTALSAKLGEQDNRTRWPSLARLPKADVHSGTMLGIPYGEVAVTVKTLLEQDEPEKARDVLLRYMYKSAGINTRAEDENSKGHFVRAYCNHLLHLVEAYE